MGGDNPLIAMASARAHKILEGKLVFGDPFQIKARQYLEQFRRVCDAMMRCLESDHKHGPPLCPYFYGIDEQAIKEALLMEWCN